MLVSEFDYELPPGLIAQQPSPERAASRLLRLDAASGAIEDLAFSDLPGLLGARDAVVLNDTRVIKARLAGRKRTGAKIAKITLHVGAGTFQPVRTAQVEEHRMHKERYAIPPDAMALLSRRKILAVGTTSLRALETAALTGELSGETGLFVYPGFQFQAVDRLLTNFHLPKSTLLMLVCAFGGKENVVKAYRHAIEKRYRFFSYGDAMLIARG